MTEPDQAKIWRERMGFTQQSLSELTGYSTASIHFFERGCKPPRPGQNEAGEAIEAWVFLRYKRACGDVDAEINGRQKGRSFSW